MAQKKSILPWGLKNNAVIGKPVRKLDRWLLQNSYRVRDRFLDNPRSAAQFAAHKKVLSASQQRVVDGLRRDGIAIVPFAELFPDELLWRRLGEDIKTFVDDIEGQLKGDPAAFDKLKKDYLIRRFKLRPKALGADDPWLLLGYQFIDIVNEYLGMWSKLVEVEHWYTRVGGGDQERIASQRWHRDPEDKKLVKIFMYFSDVDEDSGPFEYMMGTGPGGGHEQLWPWKPAVSVYPPPEEIGSMIPASSARTCTGPAGTIVFCNTSGLHRGGFCKSKPRILANWKFLSPASLASYENRLFKYEKSVPTGPLTDAVRFALA